MKYLYCFIFSVFLFASCKKMGVKEHYSYDLIPVKTADDKWGYVDKTGKFIIRAQFKYASLFTNEEGLAMVETTDGKCGFIDKTGKYVINPIYHDATDFSEGLAFVTPEGAAPVCIDIKGEKQFALQGADNARFFREGLSSVSFAGKVGYVDKKGKTVINPQFDLALNFEEGMAPVANNKGNGGENMLWGFIDKSGKIVVNPQFSSVDPFHDGIALVAMENNKKGYIDTKGNYIINPQYDGATDFSEGLAAVKMGNSWGYIDKTGKIIINPQFEDAHSFKNGLASVMTGKKWGFIDKTGKYVVNPQFDAAGKYYEGYGMVAVDNKIGFIDNSGKYIANPQFKDIFDRYLDFAKEFLFVIPDVVQSDYLDIHALDDKLLENCKGGRINNLGSTTTLRELVKMVPNGQYLTPGSTYQVSDRKGWTINSLIGVDSVIYLFKEPVRYYDYNGEESFNMDDALRGVEYFFNLEKNSSAQNKGREIALSLKEELKRRFNGTEDENAGNASYIARLQKKAFLKMIEEEADPKPDVAFVFTKDYYFTILSSDQKLNILIGFAQ